HAHDGLPGSPMRGTGITNGGIVITTEPPTTRAAFFRRHQAEGCSPGRAALGWSEGPRGTTWQTGGDGDGDMATGGVGALPTDRLVRLWERQGRADGARHRAVPARTGQGRGSGAAQRLPPDREALQRQQPRG